MQTLACKPLFLESKCNLTPIGRASNWKRCEFQGPPRFYADVLLKEATHLTEAQLVMSMWEPIIESSDTTLVTSEWAMFELAKNPKCQDRLYEEIVSVVGTERMVTEDDLPKMPYLKAVIKETLRQYPPVPLVPSRLVEEDITLGGYDVPKGFQILVNLFAVAKDPAVWSNPDKWDPERVLGDESVDMGFKNFNLMPFGAGKRMCAGITQVYQAHSLSSSLPSGNKGNNHPCAMIFELM
jgi:ent-kaurene oxidase